MMARTTILLLTGVIKSPAQGSENERTVDRGFLLSCMVKTQIQENDSPKERLKIIKNTWQRAMSFATEKHRSLAADRDIKNCNNCDQ